MVYLGYLLLENLADILKYIRNYVEISKRLLILYSWCRVLITRSMTQFDVYLSDYVLETLCVHEHIKFLVSLHTTTMIHPTTYLLILRIFRLLKDD